MAHNSNRRVRKSKHSLGVSVGAWSTPDPVLDLEKSGILSRMVLRAEPGATVTSMELVVYAGMYDSSTDPSTVPDEDIVLRVTGIGVAGSATSADEDVNLRQLRRGAPYNIIEPGTTMWVSVLGNVGAGTTQTEVSLEAVDVE